MAKFKTKNTAFEHLRKKWIRKHRGLQDRLWEKHGTQLKQLALGGIGGLMMLSLPSPGHLLPSTNLTYSHDTLENYDQNVLLAEQLRAKLPSQVEPLDASSEDEVTRLLSAYFGFKVTAEINGIRLNRNYGLIGGEQHLYRYPGDTLHAHADSADDWVKYGGSGIAPGLGAWGYFVPSKREFSEKDKMRERYYLAIQTFLAPGFAENVAKYRDFFKFRKMLLVNPKTGQAVVAVIGDVGPAQWTGKHLGGSPEVMGMVGLATGLRKGPVLYFFIDDPKDEIPLGPIKSRNRV